MPQSITVRLRNCAIAAFCLSLCIPAKNALAQCPELGWRAAGGDVNGTIHAMIEFDDGTGRAIYVAGEFTEVNGLRANRIAKWDGRNWSALGSGADGTILTLAVHEDGTGQAIYAGGQFTSIGGAAARRIAKWDGTTWSRLSTGAPATVRVIYSDAESNPPVLYVGGDFLAIGGVGANRIARWDRDNWFSLGTGMNNIVYSLAVFDDGSGKALYAGGAFTVAGGSVSNYVARWNGIGWSPVGNGSGNDYAVRHLAVVHYADGARLYASGRFCLGGQCTVIGEWNGTEWTVTGTPVAGSTVGMAVDPSPDSPCLVVSNAAGDPTLWYGGVMQLDGTTWSTIGNASFTGIQANALLVSDIGGSPALYAGGIPSGSGVSMRFAVWPSFDSFINNNANLFDDSCELENGLALDCNFNAILDETEAAADYALDDGFNMNCHGTAGYYDILWLNQFTVQPGRELITHISVASPFGAPDGWPYQVHLFSDPNQDGNPIDAELLASGSSAFLYTGWPYVAHFSPVAIPSTWVGPAGAKFFVGALTYGEPGKWMGASDPSSVQARRSWTKRGPEGEPGGLNLADLSEGYTPNLNTSAAWMLRALSIDCNDNGAWDQCDIDEGTSLDLNRNGIPDECEPVPIPCALADLSPTGGDNVVGVPDLLTILNAWGPCANPNDCPADIAPPGGDDSIGGLDLLTVINAWGPCP